MMAIFDERNQISTKEKHETLRTLVCRETDLINNRITWLLASQTILFLAFGNLFKAFDPANPVPTLTIAALGILVNWSCKSGLEVSLKAIDYFRKTNKELTNNWQCKDYLPLDYERSLDDPKYDPKKDDYWLPWKRLPWLFGIAWLLLGLVVFLIALIQWVGIEEHFAQYFCQSQCSWQVVISF